MNHVLKPVLWLAAAVVTIMFWSYVGILVVAQTVRDA